MPPSTKERAARARAARGYSGLTQKKLAAALGYSVETVSRMENGRRVITAEEVDKIVAICEGVPMSFMEFGWAGTEQTSNPAAAGDLRIRAVERRVSDVIDRMAALETSVPDRLDAIAETLTLMQQELKPAAGAGPTQKRTAEQLVDALRGLADELQASVSQLGRDIGKRDLQRHRGGDRGHQGQQGAA